MSKIIWCIKWSLLAIYNSLYLKPFRMFQLYSQKDLYRHVSYYPELEKNRKSATTIFFEQLRQIYKFGVPNYFYFPYGFDVKSEEIMSEYFHYSEFANLRKTLLKNSNGSAFILRNKLFFGMFTEALGVVSGKNVAIISQKMSMDLLNKYEGSIEQIVNGLNDYDYFVKLVDGECGTGIFVLKKCGSSYFVNGQKSSIQEIAGIIGTGQFLIQEQIHQHKEMSRLYPKSVNTIRLVTIKSRTTGKVTVLPSILRIGANGSFVDNTSQGGLAVGINLENGRLAEFGFYKPKYGTKVDKHPNTGVIFKEIVIPYFDEVKRQAILLHSVIPGIYMIGWDIAIGDSGPIFVEGNDNWEINGPQICNGGLKRVLLSALE